MKKWDFRGPTVFLPFQFQSDCDWNEILHLDFCHLIVILFFVQMYSKAVLLAFLATIAIVYAQEVERQTSLADVNDDTALLEADGAPVTREKRFLLAKKKLAIGLGVGGVVGFVKG